MSSSVEAKAVRTRKAGSAAADWLRALEASARLGREPHVTLPLLVDELAEKWGPAPALLSADRTLSYTELARRSHQYARWALGRGIGAGDVVGLMMHNCPDYVAIWLGIVRIGGIAALLNTNQSGDALAHAIGAAAPKQLIVGGDLLDVVTPIRRQLATDLEIWVAGASRPDAHCLDAVIGNDDEAGPVVAARTPALRDTALYIYTSGTTGRPKAARVSHHRIMQWSYWFSGLMNVVPADRMYNCLPLYHSVGGVVAIGAALVGGASVVIKEKFSVREFWDDVHRWNCTLFQYIGELCRYLVNAPPHPLERQHRLRLCCGNGLRGDIWERFAQRFEIPRILEFYAATEANFSLFNCEGKPGSIGRIPPFLAHRFPVALVQFDDETETPVRDQNGLCVPCAADEVGEALGRISSSNGDPGARFEGYTDSQASAAKVLRNVFSERDAWFRTGDLMRKDAAGFFYFVDRVGETFRWKGENVAALEVAETVMSCPGVKEAVVYGVRVAGAEGRAGMAAVVPGPELDLHLLHRHLANRLPDYAAPLFLRICSHIEATGTFKPSKRGLAQQGFDPSASSDALYFNCRDRGSYIPIDQNLYFRLQSGEVRL